jgi:hypothetical protein
MPHRSRCRSSCICKCRTKRRYLLGLDAPLETSSETVSVRQGQGLVFTPDGHTRSKPWYVRTTPAASNEFPADARAKPEGQLLCITFWTRSSTCSRGWPVFC